MKQLFRTFWRDYIWEHLCILQEDPAVTSSQTQKSGRKWMDTWTLRHFSDTLNVFICPLLAFNLHNEDFPCRCTKKDKKAIV